MSLEPYIQAILQDISKREGIQGAEIICETQTTKEGGFVGIVTPAELRGTNKHLKTIIKTASTHEALRAKVPLRKSFLSEIYFYDTIARELNEFRKDKGLEQLTCIPKCYGVGTTNLQEILVLEDLTESGYEVWDKKTPLGQIPIELSLQEFAKLTGVALAFKLKYPQRFSELALGVGDTRKEWLVQASMLDCCRKVCEMGKSIIGVDDKEMLNVYTKFCERIPTILLDYDYKKDPFSTILQSDCWSNNLMFKFNNVGNSKQLEKVIIIDFQLSRCGSPIFDISHFLATCADITVWNNLDHYLRVYYSTFSSTMREMGCDPEVFLPFNVFLGEFKKHATYGLAMSAVHLRGMIIDNDEVPVMLEILTDTFWSKFTAKLKNESVFEEKFRFLIKYYYENNLFIVPE